MSLFTPTLTRSEVNAAACDATMKNALTDMAPRPPAGLVLCKYGSRSVVGTIAIGGEQVVLKYYYPRSALKRVTYGVLGSRAWRSWVTGVELCKMGVPTPAPLAFSEWKLVGGLLLDRSFLAVRHVAGTDLRTFVSAYAGDRAKLDAVAQNLKKAFALMAEHRIAHGDLKATNIIVGENREVTFIDLDATSIHTPVSRWGKLRERDVAVFAANWKNEPTAREVFRAVF